MWYAIIAAAVITAAVLIILLIPVRIFALFAYGHKNAAKLDVKIGFVKLKIPKKVDGKKKTMPTDSEKTDKTGVLDKITTAHKIYSEFSEEILELIDYISRKSMVFENVKIDIEYSTGDAAATGILCGVINGAVWGALGIIDNRAGIENMDVKIVPDFNSEMLKIEASCIARLKNVHIIVIAVKLFRLCNKIRNKINGKESD